MDTKLLFQDSAAFTTSLLAVFAVDSATDKDATPAPRLLASSASILKAAEQVLSSGEFKATLGETVVLHAPAGVSAERLLLVGLGKEKPLSLDELRKGAGTALRAAKPRGLREVAIVFPETALIPEHAARVITEIGRASCRERVSSPV